MTLHERVGAWIDHKINARNALLHLLEDYKLFEPPGEISSMSVFELPWEENGGRKIDDQYVTVFTGTESMRYQVWGSAPSAKGYCAYIVEKVDSYALLFLPVDKEIKE